MNKQRKMLRLAKKSSDESLRENYFDHLESLDAKVADPLFWRSTFAAMSRRRATDPVPSAKGVADRL
jgi:hypothetical protein